MFLRKKDRKKAIINKKDDQVFNDLPHDDDDFESSGEGSFEEFMNEFGLSKAEPEVTFDFINNPNDTTESRIIKEINEVLSSLLNGKRDYDKISKEYNIQKFHNEINSFDDEPENLINLESSEIQKEKDKSNELFFTLEELEEKLYKLTDELQNHYSSYDEQLTQKYIDSISAYEYKFFVTPKEEKELILSEEIHEENEINEVEYGNTFNDIDEDFSLIDVDSEPKKWEISDIVINTEDDIKLVIYEELMQDSSQDD